nr:MAG TPA: hypothetical protein [Bacteriophage sp.]
MKQGSIRLRDLHTENCKVSQMRHKLGKKNMCWNMER